LIASRTIGVLRKAVLATSVHADRMEEAETEADVAAGKDKSELEQKIMGVEKIIAEIRGKV
jgi:hypothetical protein